MNFNEETYKIFYIEYDEDRNEIGRGMYDREYKSTSYAFKRAHELYGDRKKYDYTVAFRDPWVEYTRTHECPICKKTWESPENHWGYDMGYRFTITEWSPDTKYSEISGICPECAEKISNFVSSIMKEKGE